MTCKCGCGTSEEQARFTINLSGHIRREVFKGKEHVVAPVVMLRQGVVNKAYVAKSALVPAAWNGTPVTINHPVDAGGKTITANSPKVLETWQIGTVFNCRINGDRLVGEAWIDPEEAERLYPGLVNMLETGQPMDVSTGYYHTTVNESGKSDGKPFTAKHTELKPDHLALLPDDVGACSWQDGCGVRANQRTDQMPENEEHQQSRIMALLTKLLPQTNARGSDDDRRQIMADLLSNDASPFVPDDMYSLMELSEPTLKSLRDKYLGSAPASNQQTGAEPMADDPKTPATNNGAPATVASMSIADFTALMTNTAKAAADNAVTEALTANRRQELVAILTANAELGLTAEEIKDMPMSALEKLAKPVAAPAVNQNRVAPKTGTNYAGRGLQTNADDGGTGGEVVKYPGMVTNFDEAAKTAAAQKE